MFILVLAHSSNARCCCLQLRTTKIRDATVRTSNVLVESQFSFFGCIETRPERGERVVATSSDLSEEVDGAQRDIFAFFQTFTRILFFLNVQTRSERRETRRSFKHLSTEHEFLERENASLVSFIEREVHQQTLNCKSQYLARWKLPARSAADVTLTTGHSSSS